MRQKLVAWVIFYSTSVRTCVWLLSLQNRKLANLSFFSSSMHLSYSPPSPHGFWHESFPVCLLIAFVKLPGVEKYWTYSVVVNIHFVLFVDMQSTAHVSTSRARVIQIRRTSYFKSCGTTTAGRIICLDTCTFTMSAKKINLVLLTRIFV